MSDAKAVLEKYRGAAGRLRKFLSYAGKAEGIEAMALECWDALAASEAEVEASDRNYDALLKSLADAQAASRDESDALRARMEGLEGALEDAISDLRFVERTAPGSNFKASILQGEAALAAAGEAPESGR